MLKNKKRFTQIYQAKRVGLPPYSARFIGNLLNDKIDTKKKLKLLKHLKREPEQRRQRLKELLKKRSARKNIPLPPEYISQLKHRRLYGSYNENDLQKLAENAVELVGVPRKPLSSYGCSAVTRLNQIYMHEKNQTDMRFGAQQNNNRNGQMMRQFSASGSGIFPPQMPSQQQQMMYGQQRPPFNPYLNQQQFNGSMTPQQQQQMLMASGPHMVGQAMQMGRPSQPFPNGPSPGYPSNTSMPPNSNFNRMPFNPQQQRLGGHGSPLGSNRFPNSNQQNSQQMLGYFNNPSPASSLSSNPSQHDPTQQQQQIQRPGSVAIGSVSGSHAPLPFGSPGIPMVGSVGNTFQRTPSMPPSVAAAANNLDASSSVNNVFSVTQRSQADQAKVDEILSLFQNCKSRVIGVLMKDTILDLFYDSVFDACPICSCNANIRSAELGLYVQVPTILTEISRIQQRQQQDPSFKGLNSSFFSTNLITL